MIFFFILGNGILCVLIRIASTGNTTYLQVKGNRKDIPIMPPELAF